MKVDRILIVDSDDANVLFFEMLFKELGYEKISTAKTGSHGLELVEKDHIQFIIVAWELSAGMSGTVFIQKARTRRKRKYLPCLIYSKRMSNEDVQLTKELGFKDILSMPFDKVSAKETIKGIIDREENIDPIEDTIRKMESYLFEEKPGEALRLVHPGIYVESPFLMRAHTVTAEIWYRMNKVDQMESELEKALEIDKDYYPAHQLKAKLLSKKGQHEDAIALLQKMVDFSPKNLTSKIGLGQAFLSADRIDEAKQVFDDVMEIDQESREGKDGLATVAVVRGNVSLAAQLIAETESGNEMARMFNNIAIAKVNKGDFDEGIAIYHNAIAVLSDLAKLSRLYYNLGLAWRKKGELEKSFADLGKSYIEEPSFEKAYSAVVKTAQEMKAKGLVPDISLTTKIKEARKKYKENPTEVHAPQADHGVV